MRMTNMPPTQTNIQLYNCTDEAVQTSIINTYPKFFTQEPNRLMGMLEALVTQKSNPMIHSLSFASISQGSDRITLQNHKFLRKLNTPIIETPIPSALPLSPEPTITDMSTLHQPAKKTGNGGITLCCILTSDPAKHAIPKMAEVHILLVWVCLVDGMGQG